MIYNRNIYQINWWIKVSPLMSEFGSLPASNKLAIYKPPLTNHRFVRGGSGNKS